MDMTRREFGVAVLAGLAAVAATGCGIENESPTSPTPRLPVQNPPASRTVGQALNSLGVTVECHRRFGSGITAKSGEGVGGYIVTINGGTFGEVGDSQRIDLLNWPIGPNDKVEVKRVSNTPVVTLATNCSL